MFAVVWRSGEAEEILETAGHLVRCAHLPSIHEQHWDIQGISLHDIICPPFMNNTEISKVYHIMTQSTLYSWTTQRYPRYVTAWHNVPSIHEQHRDIHGMSHHDIIYPPFMNNTEMSMVCHIMTSSTLHSWTTQISKVCHIMTQSTLHWWTPHRDIHGMSHHDTIYPPFMNNTEISKVCHSMT